MRALLAVAALALTGCHLILGDAYSFTSATGGAGGGTSSSGVVSSSSGAMSCLPVPPTSGCGDAVCDDDAGGGTESCDTCPKDCGNCCATAPACTTAQCQVGSVCCTPPPATFTGQQFGGMGYANWTFGEVDLASISARVCFNNDPGRASGLYYQIYDFPIDGAAQYFGLQTDANGSRAIFSRFGTMDLASVRAGPGATTLASDAEGPFVSVRVDLPLGVGCFDVKVERAEASGVSDWFDMRVTRACDGTEVYVGGILFPRAVSTTHASFQDGGGSWLEVFSPETSVFDVPFVDFDVTAKANGATAPIELKSSYAERPNVDVELLSPGTARFRAGLRTPRCHLASSLKP